MPLSPSVEFFGAYFPAWLLCVVIGILGAVITRVVLIAIGIDDALPMRLFVYVCIAAVIGFVASAIGFGR